MAASTPRHLRQSRPSGARNVNSPNGSLPSGGASFCGGCASVATFEGVREARRTASGPRPRWRSSFARTALILKKVAGGRVDPRSAPGMKSAEASATTISSAANEVDVAQTLIERTSPVRKPSEPGFRDSQRGVIEDVPFVRNVSQRLCVDPRPNPLSGRRLRGSPLMRS